MSNSDLARFSGKKLRDYDLGIVQTYWELTEIKNMSFSDKVYSNRNINVSLFY